VEFLPKESFAEMFWNGPTQTTVNDFDCRDFAAL